MLITCTNFIAHNLSDTLIELQSPTYYKGGPFISLAAAAGHQCVSVN